MTEPRDRAPDEPLDDEPMNADEDIDAEEADDVDAELEATDDLDDIDETDDIDASDDIDDEAEVDDYEAAVREVAGEDVPAAPTERRERPGLRRRPTKAPASTPTPSEIAVHVREDVSKVFVIIAVGAFVVILLNAMLLGTGGLLRPLATPTPIPTASPSASPSASDGASASPSTEASPVAS